MLNLGSFGAAGPCFGSFCRSIPTRATYFSITAPIDMQIGQVCVRNSLSACPEDSEAPEALPRAEGKTLEHPNDRKLIFIPMYQSADSKLGHAIEDIYLQKLMASKWILCVVFSRVCARYGYKKLVVLF